MSKSNNRFDLYLRTPEGKEEKREVVAVSSEVIRSTFEQMYPGHKYITAEFRGWCPASDGSGYFVEPETFNEGDTFSGVLGVHFKVVKLSTVDLGQRVAAIPHHNGMWPEYYTKEVARKDGAEWFLRSESHPAFRSINVFEDMLVGVFSHRE